MQKTKDKRVAPPRLYSSLVLVHHISQKQGFWRKDTDILFNKYQRGREGCFYHYCGEYQVAQSQQVGAGRPHLCVISPL